MIKRLYTILLVCLLAAPLLLAQDSESNNSQPANIAGTWQLSWPGRSGSQQATVQIQQEGSELSGTFQGPRGPSPLTGKVDGNNVSFSVQMQGRRTMTLAFTGSPQGVAQDLGLMRPFAPCFSRLVAGAQGIPFERAH